MKKVLRLTRFLLGLLNLAALVWVFVVPLDPLEPTCATSRLADVLMGLTRLQLGPAVMALDGVILVLLVFVTFFLGRFYCEVLCPLGVAQDVVRKLSFRKAQGVRRVCCKLPVTRVQLLVRSAFLILPLALVFLGWSAYAWLDPYGIFGRAVTGASVGLFVLVLAQTFVAHGRIWCNWICPVGTLLAGLACVSYARTKTTFDTHCGDCRLCWPRAQAKEAEETK